MNDEQAAMRIENVLENHSEELTQVDIDSLGEVAAHLRERDNVATFHNDLLLQQLKTTHASLMVIQMTLEEARPLEALRTTHETVDEIDDVIEAFEGPEPPEEVLDD